MSTYKGYGFFYVNGSSHTKGGGYETQEEGGYWCDQLKSYYNTFHDVSWNSCNDVNWATRLSQQLNIPCYNEAIQGGGLERVVRKTYEFIEQHFRKENSKFFIILETPDASRLDVYYKPWNKYFVVNGGDSEAIGLPPGEDVFYAAAPTFFPKENNVADVQKDFKYYYETFYDREQQFYKNERLLDGLYSFCKQLGLPIKILDGHTRKNKFLYSMSDAVSYDNTDNDLINWCIKNEKQIKHETKGYVMDGHPGYFAHIEYAKFLKNWLDKNLEIVDDNYGIRGYPGSK